MKNFRKILSISVVAFAILLDGCGNKPTKINVEYKSGYGVVSSAFRESDSLSISEPSFSGSELKFIYRNMNKDKIGSYVFGIIIKAYNEKGIEVDLVDKVLYPGEVQLPCSGKIISVPILSKQEYIARIKITHVGGISRERSNRTLKELLNQ